jgi:hypothetical protein
MVITYDNPSDFSMTFSNRLRLDNAGFIFTDLVGNNNNVSTTVGFNSAQWGNWEANYKDTVTTFISSALDASVNMLMSSDDEEITISNVGLRGQRLISPGVYSDQKVWLTSNLLAFTDDNWLTAKLALGEINAPGGGTAYGLAAEFIVGELVASSQLIVSNTAGTFSVDADGATLIDSTLTVTSSTGNARLLIDPLNTRIFRIQKNIASVFTDMLYVDTSGNITFTGALSGATGSFTGSVSASSGNIGTWTINAYGIQSTDLSAKLWSFADGTYDMNIGSFVVVDDSVTRYVDYQGDTFNINVSDQVTFTPTNTFNIGTNQVNLNIPDSTTGLQVRGSPTYNSDITITAGNTLVIRNGLIFDYF